MGRRGIWCSWVLGFLLFVFAVIAFAEQPHQRSVSLSRSEESLLISTSFSDLIDEGARHKLDSGFWNRVVVRLNTRDADADPVALSARTCRMRHEIWEEHYEVLVEDQSGRTKVRFESAREAIARCTTLTRFPAAQLSDLEAGEHEIEIIAELNPMSEELLESVRRWIRSPQGSERSLSQGSNFFGSVVSIFVNNRIGRSDRMIHFRSQSFVIPPRPGS